MTRERSSAETDGASLAAAREGFLRVETPDTSGAREAILASWWRSREADVAADRLELQYVRDPNLDTPLTRSAEPVLAHLREQLDGSSARADRPGRCGPQPAHLRRGARAAPRPRQPRSRLQLRRGRRRDQRHRDGARGRWPMHVFGHEHYAEHLEQLACAGVPVRHPVSGKTVGVLDLTCWRRDAGPLLMTLAKTTAEQIRQALLTETGMREIELLHAYMRACRHSSGMVFALNNDVVMMNETARRTLVAGDQSALLRHAAEALADRREAASVELPSGVQVRLHTRPVQADGRTAGGVVDVRVVEPAVARAAGPVRERMLLPGLVGAGPLWRRACVEAERVYSSGSWLVVEGEPGSGKSSLLQALHQRVNPGGRLSVLEPDVGGGGRWVKQACETLADKDGTIVLRHLERLPDSALRMLTAGLQDASARRASWVAVTVPPRPPGPELTRLLRLFPCTVGLPPLRHHIEDVELLVPYLLMRLGQGGQLTVSPEALQLLTRFDWPGNVEQLLATLRSVLRHRRTGVVTASDLPPEIQSLARRRLTPLESLERDAIVFGLQDAAGNKAKAARALGMSRATIYRKIHEYGITGAALPAAPARTP